MLRLDKFLSEVGFTRTLAVEHIKNGDVAVNGKIINQKDFKVNENQDEVCVNNEKIVYSKFVYIMINKPDGVLSATEDKTQTTVINLLPNRLQNLKLFPVGRLDKETVGLLILTNDGKYCHKMISPKNNVNKIYKFELADEINDNDILKIEGGIELKDGYVTLPCKIEMQDKKHGHITICEGKYHQIRRMFGAVGNKVIFLERIMEGKVKLDTNLKRGEWRYLTSEEIDLF